MIYSTTYNKEKNIYLEAMRVIAIFFVIFNHTGSNGYTLFSQEPIGSGKFWIYLFISVFCKFSVPLFFANFQYLCFLQYPVHLCLKNSMIIRNYLNEL